MGLVLKLVTIDIPNMHDHIMSLRHYIIDQKREGVVWTSILGPMMLLEVSSILERINGMQIKIPEKQRCFQNEFENIPFRMLYL